VEFLSGDSENPSRGECWDVEQVVWASKHIFMFVFAISQLNSTCLYHALLLLFSHTCLTLCSHLYWSKRAIEAHQLL